MSEQDVLNRLGDKDGSAGKAIVDFFNEAMASNREEIDRLANKHNQRVADILERERDLVSRATYDELKDEVDTIKRGLTVAADALKGAVTAHNHATDNTASSANVEAAQAASNEAEQAGLNVDTRIEGLETRVSELERRVGNHEERISALEGRAAPIRIDTPNLVPDEAPVVVDQPTRTQRVVHNTNPANWQGWQPWAGAIVLTFVGLLLGQRLTDASSDTLWSWLAWMFIPITIAVGFFLGGFIGNWLKDSPPPARTVEA